MSGWFRLSTNYNTLLCAPECSRQAPTITCNFEDSRTHTRWPTPVLHSFLFSPSFLHPHIYRTLLSLMNVLPVLNKQHKDLKKYFHSFPEKYLPRLTTRHFRINASELIIYQLNTRIASSSVTLNVTRLRPTILVCNLRAPVVYYTLWRQYSSSIRLGPTIPFHHSLIPYMHSIARQEP